MLIQVNENYRITSDPYNIIIEERQIAGERAKVPGAERWVAIKFFPNLEQASVWLLNRALIVSGDQSIDELIKTVNTARDEIVRAVRERGVA